MSDQGHIAVGTYSLNAEETGAMNEVLRTLKQLRPGVVEAMLFNLCVSFGRGPRRMTRAVFLARLAATWDAMELSETNPGGHA